MSGLFEEIAGLTDLLRCPVTGQRLRIANPAEIAPIAAKAPADTEGFLIREDGQAAYPVKNGIPTLLAEAAIVLAPADRKPES
jgi:uncharacterized protein YbaR (Trm112 family)